MARLMLAAGTDDEFFAICIAFFILLGIFLGGLELYEKARRAYKRRENNG